MDYKGSQKIYGSFCFLFIVPFLSLLFLSSSFSPPLSLSLCLSSFSPPLISFPQALLFSLGGRPIEEIDSMVKSDKLMTTFPAYPALYVNELTGKKIAILGSGKEKEEEDEMKNGKVAEEGRQAVRGERERES
jgi:hypothetical protein